MAENMPVADTETSVVLSDGRTLKTITHPDGSVTEEYFGTDGKLQFPVVTENPDGTREVAS